MDKRFRQIIDSIQRFAATATDLQSLQEFSVKLVAERLPNYNWVGFYMLDSENPNLLILRAFHGTPIEHTRIPITEGICGAAVAQGETVVVDDVASDPRYLARSIETRSEIVVPIRADGEIYIDNQSLRRWTSTLRIRTRAASLSELSGFIYVVGAVESDPTRASMNSIA